MATRPGSNYTLSWNQQMARKEQRRVLSAAMSPNARESADFNR